MKRRIIWLVLSCLMVLSLVLVACAPAATEKKEEVTPAVKEVTPAVKEVAPAVKEAAPVAEKPRYGGTIRIGLGTQRTELIGDIWDQLYSTLVPGPPLSIIYEELLMGDWAKGPAGTKETNFRNAFFAPDGVFIETGALAESWEIPDNQTLIFHIRKGVYWQNKPPVNGREFTPSDAVFGIRRYYLNPEYPAPANVLAAPGGKKVTDVYIDPNDPRTVVVKVEDLAPIFLEDVADKTFMYSREVIEQYGSARDWRYAVGTGPFIVTDFVSGSSATLVRNPNYWLKDPVGPGKGNQLPYADSILLLQLPDISTRVAALRTGKTDYSYFIGWEDAESLRKSNPEIGLAQHYQTGGLGLSARPSSTDPRAEPFKKKRVRQAIAMAIDNEALVRDYYGGSAHVLKYLILPDSPFYTPLSEMPEIVQKMYGYHPEEAKRILAEEGYPNGFKTTLLLTAPDADLYSIIKGYLAKVNVDLELDIRELGAVTTVTRARTQPALTTSGGITAGYAEKWTTYGPPEPDLPRAGTNTAEVNDPTLNAAIERANAAYGDYPAVFKIIKEIEPYVIEQAWYIQLPAQYYFVVYQPWLKNNYGAFSVGYRNYFDFPRFAWVDQDLKKAMGY